MWLKLNLGGIIVSLRIRPYEKNNEDDYIWCEVDYSFCAEPWLNYVKQSNEVLLTQEVDDLAEVLERLLADQLDAPCRFSCAEPDFVFYLKPQEDLRNNPRHVYVRPGYEIVDIAMEWQVHFWGDRGLTANYLTVVLGREEIECLLTYLKIVTGQLSEQDTQVQKTIRKGVIC